METLKPLLVSGVFPKESFNRKQLKWRNYWNEVEIYF